MRHVLINLNIIINFVLQLIVKKLDLELTVNYINFNVNTLNEQLFKNLQLI